jgi:hypothetical protein
LAVTGNFYSAEFWKVRYFHHRELYVEVGTRYIFRSPLPLVRYSEIVLPLRGGPLLSKI